MIPAYHQKLIETAVRLIDPDESALLIHLLDRALDYRLTTLPRQDILQIVKAGTHSTAFNSLALYLHRCIRELTGSDSVVQHTVWVRALLQLNERLHSVRPSSVPTAAPNSTETSSSLNRPGLLAESGNGEYVQAAYAILLGRSASAWEIDHWVNHLEHGSMTRETVLASLFESAKTFFGALADSTSRDGLSCQIMGTDELLTSAQWNEEARTQIKAATRIPKIQYNNRFRVTGRPRILVSALASLYRGGAFIKQFMKNITGQDGFDEHCELVIVDANSPENEYSAIEPYLERHKNIIYMRFDYRLGIYDAWNVAARRAQGKYLTNTNMDDLRRRDSLMVQAATLENLDQVDVVYQDFFYTFDPKLSFDEIASFGHQTSLPVITPHNMLRFNSPHNAPMWRKSLHKELGYFDTNYKSAGDYEFWMRCLAAGKNFFKINDPHVAYYQNPDGLSTKSDSRIVLEVMNATKTHGQKLIPSEVLMSRSEFISELNLGSSNRRMGSQIGRYGLAQEALRSLARHAKYN